MQWLERGLVILLLAIVPAIASAQQKGGLKITSMSEIEITTTNSQGGKEVKRVDATKSKVLPGESVIYTNYYSYSGEQPATDVAIKNPIPQHMEYVNGSAEGRDSRIEFSADGGKTFAAAGKLNVKTPEGRERTAVAADYTHVRWTIEKPIRKGGKGSVSFRAKVK